MLLNRSHSCYHFILQQYNLCYFGTTPAKHLEKVFTFKHIRSLAEVNKKSILPLLQLSVCLGTLVGSALHKEKDYESLLTA